MAKKKKKRPSTTNKPAAEAADAPSFEESLQELEQIVRDLEAGNLGLNDSLKRYEEGVRRLRECHATLEHVEQKIELLTRINADGSARSEPFAESTTSDLEQKQAQRSRRRSSERPEDDIDGPPGLF